MCLQEPQTSLLFGIIYNAPAYQERDTTIGATIGEPVWPDVVRSILQSGSKLQHGLVLSTCLGSRYDLIMFRCGEPLVRMRRFSLLPFHCHLFED